MHSFDPAAYRPVFGPLLDTDRCRPLDAGSPADSVRPQLAALSVENAFEGGPIADRQMAECCVSGVWLLYDFLDESHSLSQNIGSPSGSFWHGIMHRREGDFSNAKYWFRRVGGHPVYGELAAASADISKALPDSPAASALDAADWDAFAFVDLCEAAVRGRGDRALCEAIQQAEWELLFDHCYRSARGA